MAKISLVVCEEYISVFFQVGFTLLGLIMRKFNRLTGLIKSLYSTFVYYLPKIALINSLVLFNSFI